MTRWQKIAWFIAGALSVLVLEVVLLSLGHPYCYIP
jgi:hypothetical protein